MAGTVNHATNIETAKITDTLFGTWYCDGKRGVACARKNRETAEERESRLEARTAHKRRQNAMTSTEQG